MKFVLTIIILALVVFGIMSFLKNKKAADQNMTNEEALAGQIPEEDMSGTYVFDTEASSAKWTGGKKIIKNYEDSGSIKIKSGTVVFDKGMITGGEVVFDMTSITGEETSNTKVTVDKLSEHLKSEDFFEVETYPEAKYEVTDSKKTDSGYTLNGNLTLKGKTAPLMIPVKVITENGNIAMAGTAEVNRANWDVKYGSETFFSDLGDAIINDIFTLDFNVIARP